MSEKEIREREGYLGDGQDFGRGYEDGLQTDEGPAYIDGFIKGFARGRQLKRRQKMSEKEESEKEEIDVETYKALWRSRTKLRIIELLTNSLPPHLESTVDTCKSIEILDVIRNLVAE